MELSCLGVREPVKEASENAVAGVKSMVSKERISLAVRAVRGLEFLLEKLRSKHKFSGQSMSGSDRRHFSEI